MSVGVKLPAIALGTVMSVGVHMSTGAVGKLVGLCKVGGGLLEAYGSCFWF